MKSLKLLDESLNSNLQDAYNSFFDILKTALEKHSPLQTPPHKRKNIYMTKEAVRLKNAKRRLWKRYLSTKRKYEINIHRLCAMTRGLRQGFEHTLALNIKKIPKAFCISAKSRLRTKQCIPPLVRRMVQKPQQHRKKQTLDNFFCKCNHQRKQSKHTCSSKSAYR